MERHQLVIIGGGSAGIAAALGAYENGLKDILVIEREKEYGGILQQCIHNGFGLHTFNEELSGPAYAEKYYDLIKDNDSISFIYEAAVTEIKDKCVIVSTPEGLKQIEAEAIVIATGCRERPAGAIGLKGNRCEGVYTAGTAQKYLNKQGYLVGKKIFILGSGDIGLIMARRMTLEGAKVLGIAELMPYSNGLQRNIVQCLKDYGIPLYLSHTVTNIEGFPRLSKVTISEVDANRRPIPGTEKVFEVDTLLLSVGLVPDNTLTVEAGIHLDPRTRGVEVNEYCESPMPGVFAAGNVLHVHDLVDYVTAEGRKAGRGAAKYLKGELKERNGFVTKAGNGIGYVLPQRVDYPSEDATVEFSFRVRTPYKNAKIVVKDGDTVIREIKKPALLPAEMEKVVLPNNILVNIKNDLTIEVKEA